MNNAEHHEYLCMILSKLVDSDLTSNELKDLASALGIKVSEFYGLESSEDQAEIVEVIEWKDAA